MQLIVTKRIGNYTFKFSTDGYATYQGTYDIGYMADRLEEEIYVVFKKYKTIPEFHNIIQGAVLFALALICTERWNDEIKIEMVEI